MCIDAHGLARIPISDRCKKNAMAERRHGIHLKTGGVYCLWIRLNSDLNVFTRAGSYSAVNLS